MSKKKLSKYDIAISFTDKDDAIAKKMAAALRRKRLNVYYYKRENHFGDNLMNVTPNVYRNRSNYGLVILSRAYRQKSIPMNEWRELKKGRAAYRVKKIFVIRLDDNVQLPGLHKDKIYEKWDDNAPEIARKIKQQMNYPPYRVFKLVFTLLFILLITAGIYYFN